MIRDILRSLAELLCGVPFETRVGIVFLILLIGAGIIFWLGIKEGYDQAVKDYERYFQEIWNEDDYWN